MIYKLQNGWTIPLGGDYLEYLQNVPEVSGGSIQPAVKTEKLPEKFHGSQKAARTYAEGYQKGAKPVTKAIDNAGQKIFNTTKKVAMFVPGPVGTVTWLGQMGADTANGEYEKVARDVGAAALMGVGLKGIQTGAKAVGRTLAGKGVNIPWLDAYDYSALRNEYFTNAGNKVIAKATPDIVQMNIEAGKLGWAPSSKQTLWHNSDQPLTKLEINFPAWDITQRGAPLGHSWFTGTETAQGFMSKRPYHLRGTVELNKPIIQIGESIGDGKNITRNQILDFAQKSSADGINFKGIADNTLKNQDIYAIFKNTEVKPKLSEAERLGIPKGERSSPKALEDPYYWGYQQWNSRYNAAVNSGNIQEAQRLRDLHFKIKAPDTKVVDKLGRPLRTYHGLLNHKLPEEAEKFTIFEGVNWDLEDAVAGGSKVNHWKLSVPNWDVMCSYHTPDYSTALGYAWDDPNMLYTDYLNIKNPFTWNEDNLHNILLKSGHKSEKIPYVEHGWWKRNYAKTVNGDFIRDTNGRPIEISSEWIPEKHTFRYPNVSDWSYFGGNSKRELMKLGYDGLYIPQYYDSYGAFVSPSQFKSAEPITRTDTGEIIPIVKRDNFHNLDRRYKQGGIIKGQNGFLNTWQKAYNSKFGKGLRDFMFGKDSDLSDEEYLEKHGYNKPVGGLGPLVEMTTIGPIADFSGVEHLVKGTFGNGGVKANVGLQNLNTEKRALQLAKSYEEELKRDKAALEWAGKKWNELTNTEQYWLKVRQGHQWNDKLIVPRNI